MKSFLKQVLAFLVALTIFGIGSCAYIGHRLQFAAEEARKEAEAKRQADEKAERERIIQFNQDFAEQQGQLIDDYKNRISKQRPQN